MIKRFSTVGVFKSFTKRKFVKNVATVATGTAAAQVIGMLFSPIITRLYGPEVFGIIGTFNSILLVASTVVALTYPIAIVLPKGDSEAKGLIKLSLFVAGIMSFLTLLILVLFGGRIANILKIEMLYPYLFFIPILMFISAGRQVTEQWLLRKKQFKITAKIIVIQTFIVNSAKVGIGFYYPFAMVLIFITSVGHFLHMLLLILGAKKTYKSSESNRNIQDSEVDSSMFVRAKRYSDFPIYRSPQVFIAAVTQSMPVIMLSAMFSPVAAGLYTIGLTVLGLPSQLIGKSIGDVFYPRISEAKQNKENISNLLSKATNMLAIIGIVPFGIIIIFGPTLFSFVFGDSWGDAGVYARWIALWSYALFVSNPTIKTLPVLLEQRFYLIFTILNIIIRGSMLLIGGVIFKDSVVSVALFGISGAFLNLSLILITLTKSKAYDAKLKK